MNKKTISTIIELALLVISAVPLIVEILTQEDGKKSK